MQQMTRLQQTRHALGSEIRLTIVAGDNAASDELFEQLWMDIRLFEATFSRFRPDSELTYVNRQAGNWTDASPEFSALAAVAQKLSHATGGLYNPFVLPNLQAAGYKGSWPNPKQRDPGLDFSTRRLVPVEELELGDGKVRIPAGSALDFGGIGKGYLLDQLAVQLDKAAIQNFWLSLGGDILCDGHDVDGRPWRVGVQAARDEQAVAYARNLSGKLAIATSGTTKRKGPGWHHLIDPRSGKPAETDVLTATVCLPSATEADVYAKCLVLLGTAEVKRFATAHGLDAVVVQSIDKAGPAKIYKTGEVFV